MAGNRTATPRQRKAPTAPNLSIEHIDVTPALAHEWLGTNLHNRNLRSRSVFAYSEDMKRGDWIANGDTIKFSADDELLDGQHRLAALVEADVTLPMIVVHGLADAARDTLDTGIPRRFGDVLALRGEVNVALLASVTRRADAWINVPSRVTSGRYHASNIALLSTLHKHPELRDVVRHTANIYPNTRMLPSINALCYWLFDQLSPKDCDVFFERLAYGEGLYKGDAILELRKFIDETFRLPHARRSGTYLCAVTIKAWNAWRDNQSIKTLAWRAGGASPEPMPEPI